MGNPDWSWKDEDREECESRARDAQLQREWDINSEIARLQEENKKLKEKTGEFKKGKQKKNK